MGCPPVNPRLINLVVKLAQFHKIRDDMHRKGQFDDAAIADMFIRDFGIWRNKLIAEEKRFGVCHG